MNMQPGSPAFVIDNPPTFTISTPWRKGHQVECVCDTGEDAEGVADAYKTQTGCIKSGVKRCPGNPPKAYGWFEGDIPDPLPEGVRRVWLPPFTSRI